MDYYNGKVLLLTGATGFVGKIVLQKILFALPLVSRVYILVRSKKGLSLKERFRRELMASACYDRLRSVHGLRYQEFVEQKVVPIQGDLNVPGLGLSKEDRATLVREVDCILSIAASVEFNSRLDQAIKTNILGVLQLLKIAKEAERLSSMTHMSTCYVNTNLPEGLVQEKIYAGTTDPEDHLRELLSLPLDDLIKDTARIIQGFPNTYTFTKNLCERILSKVGGGLSLTIVRPSIISSSVKEPAVGWVDSVVAVGAIYLYGGIGILKHLHCQEKKIGDLIPVDIVADYTLVANACHAGKREFNVHHCGSSYRNPVTWGNVRIGARNYFTQNVPEQGVAKWTLELIGSQLVTRMKQGARRMSLSATQRLAALVGSQKLRKDIARFKKQVGKAELINEVFQFFMNNEFIFEQHRVSELIQFMRPEEREKFNVDSASIDIDHWICLSSYGIHKFILRERVGEPPESDMFHAGGKKSYFDDLNWAVTHPAEFGPHQHHYYRAKLLHSVGLREAVEDYIATQGKKGVRRDRAEAEARKMTEEALGSIICRQQTASLRMFAWSLHKIFRRMFERIEVKKEQLERIKELEGPVLLLPNHRSYLDYVLISYIFFSYGLKLPYVSSDDSVANILFVSRILKNSGAFEFSLKKYRANRIYRAVLDEYIKELMCDRATVLHFLEGTRSRTGKTLQPNFELLQAVIEGLDQCRYSEVTVVPVAINYERVIQGDTFPLQLMGEEKVQESFLRLLKSARLLGDNFGEIHVDFGEPIPLSHFRNSFEDNHAVRLGMEVIHRINEQNVILPVSMVSAVVLQHRKGISEDMLAKKVQWLYRLVLERGHRIGGVNQISPSVTVRSVVGHLSNVVTKSRHNVFQVNLVPGKEYQNILLLSYYRNMLLHVFANEGLLLICLHANGQQSSRQEGVTLAELETELAFAVNLLKREVMLRDALSLKNFAEGVEVMKERGILEAGTRPGSVRISKLGEQAAQFMLSLVWPIAESYWATVSYLGEVLSRGEMKVRAFIEQVQWFAECMHDDRVMEFYESCSVETIRNAVDALAECQLITVRKDSLTPAAPHEVVTKLEERIRRYLRNAIEKANLAKL